MWSKDMPTQARCFSARQYRPVFDLAFCAYRKFLQDAKAGDGLPNLTAGTPSYMILVSFGPCF